MRKTAALLLVLAASGAEADEIRLVNGGTLQGIERSDPARPGRVVLEIGIGIVEFDASQVLSRTPGRTVLHEYYERWERVKDSRKASDFFELAQWAKANRCPKFVPDLCRRALGLDPEHAGARAELGHQKVDGKWMTFEEAQAAKGLVYYGGRWVTAAERDLAERERLEARERAEAARRARELRREEERQERMAVLREIHEQLAREALLPYGYLYRPSWFWPAYYRPYPWLPYQYKRPPGGWGAGWGWGEAVPTLDLGRFIRIPYRW